MTLDGLCCAYPCLFVSSYISLLLVLSCPPVQYDDTDMILILRRYPIVCSPLRFSMCLLVLCFLTYHPPSFLIFTHTVLAIACLPLRIFNLFDPYALLHPSCGEVCSTHDDLFNKFLFSALYILCTALQLHAESVLCSQYYIVIVVRSEF